MNRVFLSLTGAVFGSLSLMGCQPDSAEQNTIASSSKMSPAMILPMTDPENSGGWVLNEVLSDEFNQPDIDHDKWLVQGYNDEYYIWKGRPPSQFAPHNVFIEDGVLQIRTQWEPDFNFARENYADGERNDQYGVHEGAPMPVTTGAVVSKKRFLHGYMEARTKAVDAAMTSAFWLIGHESELDVYEQMGSPKIDANIKEDTFFSTVHDWRPPAVRPTSAFNYTQKMPYRMADDFHVFGVEWGEDFLKYFIDGELIHTVYQKDVESKWVLTNPMEIWFDSEIFVWLGLPHAEELPDTYEIDYIRVWQKPSDNLLQSHFFGFEGPALYQDTPRPLKLLPEHADDNGYQKFWQIDKASQPFASISYDRKVNGLQSLKFYAEEAPQQDVVVTSPEGLIDLAPGKYELEMKVLVMTGGGQPNRVNLALENTDITLSPLKFGVMARGSWTPFSQTFEVTSQTGNQAKLKISIPKKELEGKGKGIFIDNIKIRRVE